MFKLLIRGWSEQQIAQQLGIAKKAVHWQRKKVYWKLDTHTRAGLVEYAREYAIPLDEPLSEVVKWPVWP